MKLLFVVTEDWYFVSHRLSLAAYFVARGWDVAVVTQINTEECRRQIEAAGVRTIDCRVKRGVLLSPGDLSYIAKLISIYRQERPDIVHHVAMKPVLWGSIASLFRPKAKVVNALAGMGYLYTHNHAKVKLARAVIGVTFRWLFSRANTRVIVQNVDDLEMFVNKVGIARSQLRIIRGAGVDVSRFRPAPHGLRAAPVIVMVSRMLRDKGVGELAAAARQLKARGVAAEVQLVGPIDPKNPNSYTETEMQALQTESAITWRGHSSDVAGVLESADIAVLPSYREGLPKSLIEAAAAGLPIVTSDAPGCREVVAHGDNGFLVPVKDSEGLAKALQTLAEDPQLRRRMGLRSRARAEAEFCDALVWQKTEEVYRELTAGG